MGRLILIGTAMFVAVQVAVPARCEVVEIPLSGLNGLYPAGANGRTAEVHVPGPPASVSGAAIRIRGVATVGQYGGNDAALCPFPVPWVMEFTAALGEDATHAWGAWVLTPESPGAFEGTEEFWYALGVTDFTFLLDGSALLILTGHPTGMPLGCTPATIAPEATVTEATLILEGEFPVQTQGTTWGRLKALFR